MGPTWICGRPGGSQREQPAITPSVTHASASVTSKFIRKSQGSSAARRSGLGTTHSQAGSSWKARASMRLAAATWLSASRTISIAGDHNPAPPVPASGYLQSGSVEPVWHMMKLTEISLFE